MKRDLLPITDIREAKIDLPVGAAMEDSVDPRTIKLGTEGAVMADVLIQPTIVVMRADARFKIKKGDALFARKGTGLIYPIRPRRK